MLELEKSASLVVLTLSFWSVLALWLDEKGYRPSNRLFALLLVSTCVPQLYFYSWYLKPGGDTVLGKLSLSLIWSKGPLLYFCTRLTLRKRIRGSYYLHSIPLCAAALLNVSNVVNPVHLIPFGMIHVLAYSCAAVKNWVKHKSSLAIIFYGCKSSAYYWQLFVIFGLSVVIALDMVTMGTWMYSGTFLFTTVRCITLVMSLYLVCIAFFSIYRPSIFYNKAHQESGDTQKEPCEKLPNPVIATAKYRALDEEVASSLRRQLDQLMEESKLFRYNELTLQSLAEHMEVTTHHLSELLNLPPHNGFYNYINGKRLEYACQLLANPDCKLRILDIAFESGFSNKNSFYKQFREKLQQTPLEYRSNLAQTTL